MTYDSTIFESLLKESQEMNRSTDEDSTLDITESIDLSLTDETIDQSECRLNAYGVQVTEAEGDRAYNVKNNPDKAIDIFFSYPQKNLVVEVFLETESKEWNSKINGKDENRLSPEQMGTFFKTKFFSQLKDKLQKCWPCQKDPMFKDLSNGIVNKKYKIDFDNIYRKGDEESELNEWEVTKRKVKLGQPNEKDASGRKIRSSSGRKLVNFNDMGVSKGEEAYYSWPGGTDDKHIFKWSRWNNWENQKPFLRARFSYNVAGGAVGADVIGISLTLQPEDDKNRGWISYNLSLIPSLQYLTPEETQDILKLSLMRKFMRECLNRINPILDIPDEEIFKRINKPDKCTLDDIRKTKSVIRNTLKAVRDPRPNTFVYT